MDTRGRKKRRVAGFSSEADFVDLEDSQSDDVMCSQYVNDDSFGDKSSSDVEMLSEVSFFLFVQFYFIVLHILVIMFVFGHF